MQIERSFRPCTYEDYKTTLQQSLIGLSTGNIRTILDYLFSTTVLELLGNNKSVVVIKKKQKDWELPPPRLIFAQLKPGAELCDNCDQMLLDYFRVQCIFEEYEAAQVEEKLIEYCDAMTKPGNDYPNHKRGRNGDPLCYGCRDTLRHHKQFCDLRPDSEENQQLTYALAVRVCRVQCQVFNHLRQIRGLMKLEI
jgi:hypothetical protein